MWLALDSSQCVSFISLKRQTRDHNWSCWHTLMQAAAWGFVRESMQHPNPALPFHDSWCLQSWLRHWAATQRHAAKAAALQTADANVVHTGFSINKVEPGSYIQAQVEQDLYRIKLMLNAWNLLFWASQHRHGPECWCSVGDTSHKQHELQLTLTAFHCNRCTSVIGQTL